MSELEEIVRQIARDIVLQEHGEDIEESKAGISFRLPMQIDGRSVIARYAWYRANLAFDSAGVYDNSEELTEYENHDQVVQQLRRLNNHYDGRLRRDVLRRFGLRDREHLMNSLR